jgi:hypothetical protein
LTILSMSFNSPIRAKEIKGPLSATMTIMISWNGVAPNALALA